MPIYEYVCQDCGDQFDMLRPMKDADKTAPCKHCESLNTSRAISAFFAHSGGRTITPAARTGCGSCSGGSCGSCASCN